MINVFIVGNCQGQGLARLMPVMAEGITASAMVPTPDNLQALRSGAFDRQIGEADLVLLQPGAFQRTDGTGAGGFDSRYHDADPSAEVWQYVTAIRPSVTIRAFPRILFSAYHPDVDFVRTVSGAKFAGVAGHHSSIAFYGWTQGLDVAATVALYNEDVYERLGFFEYWQASRAFLLEEGRLAGIPLGEAIDRWTARGPWMYSFNHPRLRVLADLAALILAREGVPSDAEAAVGVEDELAKLPMFPVYPELACRLGVEGHYRFQLGWSGHAGDTPHTVPLEEFVRLSFEAYATAGPGGLVCHRLESERYQRLAAVAVPAANRE